MSANYTRIRFRFKTEEDWNSFVLKGNSDPDNCGGFSDGAISMGGGMFLDESTLGAFVEYLSEQIGDNGIIIADTTNYSVDPYACCAFYLGDKVRQALFCREDDDVGGDYQENFEFCGKSEKYDIVSSVSIKDIPAWLEYGGFELNEKEKEMLSLVLEKVDDEDSEEEEDMHTWEVFPDEYEYVKELLQGKSLPKPVEDLAKELVDEYLHAPSCFLAEDEMYMPFFGDEFNRFTAFVTEDIAKRFPQ